MDVAYKGIAYSTYALLAIGLLINNNIIPLELMGLMQLAHISTANLDWIVLPLFPIMNTSAVQGFNFKLDTTATEVPIRALPRLRIGYAGQLQLYDWAGASRVSHCGSTAGCGEDHT